SFFARSLCHPSETSTVEIPGEAWNGPRSFGPGLSSNLPQIHPTMRKVGRDRFSEVGTEREQSPTQPVPRVEMAAERRAGRQTGIAAPRTAPARTDHAKAPPRALGARRAWPRRRARRASEVRV